MGKELVGRSRGEGAVGKEQWWGGAVGKEQCACAAPSTLTLALHPNPSPASTLLLSHLPTAAIIGTPPAFVGKE